MSSLSVQQPVAMLIRKHSFHTKEIPGAKRYASVRVSVDQSHAVRVPLEHKANDDCVKQHSKSQVLIKPRLLLEENDGQKKHTAGQQAKLKFPELLKNMRRNQHHKNRTECSSHGNRKIKARQKITCWFASHQLTMADHANGEERNTKNRDLD